MPEDDDESVEDVEADTDVSTEPVGNHLQQHFNGEQPAEEHVAVLEDLRQRRRLQPTKRCSWYIKPVYLSRAKPRHLVDPARRQVLPRSE